MSELDLTDESQRKLSQLEKRRKDRDISDLKKVLGDVEGRRFVWRILSESGIFRGSFNANALAMAFNEGKRDIGLLVIGEINGNVPQRLFQMQGEFASDMKNEKAERSKILGSGS
jgi:hypothetical protein